MPKKRFLKIAIYILIPVAFGSFIIYENIPIDGQISQNLNFGTVFRDKIISQIYPPDRADNVRKVNGQKVLPITNDNAYFDITFPPISYDQLALTLRFSQPENVPEVRLGIPRGPDQYENILLANKYIDNLDWDRIEEGSLVLWQKKKQYDSIEEFLANPPQDKITAVHPTAPTPQLIIPDYQPNTANKALPAGLEGPHGLFTYIKGQNLFFSFTKEGKSESANTERARVLDFRGKEIEKIDITEPGDYAFDIPQLDEGLYRVEILLEPTNSIVNITTNLDKLAAKNILWLAKTEVENEPIDVTFAGDNLTITALDENGTQQMDIADSMLNISEVNRPEVVSDYFPEIEYLDVVNIKLTKTPIRFEGKGFFTWREDLFFNPLPDYTFQLSPGTTPDEFATADFVIAKYNNRKESEGTITRATVEMPVNSLYVNDNVSPFVISTPGLAHDCEEILLEELSVTLKRPPLSWAELKKIGSKIIPN